MESKARIFASNHDLDEYWESFGHYIEGRLVELVKRQEMYCQDMSFDQLQEMLRLEIPRGFKEDAEKAIHIDLINDTVAVYTGDDPYGDVFLEIDETANAFSTFKALVELTNGHKLYVKLEFNIPE